VSGIAIPRFPGPFFSTEVTVKARVQHFLQDRSAITAIEYALLASLIAIFIVVTVQAAGVNLKTFYEYIRDSVVEARQ